MKKLIFHLCLFFIPTLLNCISYDEAAQQDPVAFEWVQRFAKSGNKVRGIINSIAKQKGDSIRGCVENMNCENLALLVTTPTYEGKSVQELFPQYPFFKQLFEEQQKRCQNCKDKTISEPVKPKLAATQKPTIPAKYNPIIKLCTTINCVQRQEEHDLTILNIIAHNNSRRTLFEKFTKNFKFYASPF